jgi:hypothetical protein
MSREKQIEEMAKLICLSYGEGVCRQCDDYDFCTVRQEAERFYNAGYRKQSEGEWQIVSEIYKLIDDVDEELYVECQFCKRRFPVPYEFDDEKIFKYAREHYPYCNCGAKMKGGAE